MVGAAVKRRILLFGRRFEPKFLSEEQIAKREWALLVAPPTPTTTPTIDAPGSSESRQIRSGSGGGTDSNRADALVRPASGEGGRVFRRNLDTLSFLMTMSSFTHSSLLIFEFPQSVPSYLIAKQTNGVQCTWGTLGFEVACA